MKTVEITYKEILTTRIDGETFREIKRKFRKEFGNAKIIDYKEV